VQRITNDDANNLPGMQKNARSENCGSEADDEETESIVLHQNFKFQMDFAKTVLPFSFIASVSTNGFSKIPMEHE